MTTTVKVSAHCDSETTKVRIIEGSRDTDPNGEKLETHIEDGQEVELHVYDDNYLTIDEIPK